ncbi:hypothetical protein Hanom_Chr06g00561021 [Helianthus anomalus]
MFPGELNTLVDTHLTHPFTQLIHHHIFKLFTLITRARIYLNRPLRFIRILACHKRVTLRCIRILGLLRKIRKQRPRYHILFSTFTLIFLIRCSNYLIKHLHTTIT